MVQLTIHRGFPTPGNRTVIFQSLANIAPSTHLLYPHYLVDKVKQIHENEHIIFRAQLTLDTASTGNGVPTTKPLDVILKTNWMEFSIRDYSGLVKEGQIYTSEHVEQFLGCCIPEYYGLFETYVESRKIVCLVLEYCGEPVKLKDLSKVFA